MRCRAETGVVQGGCFLFSSSRAALRRPLVSGRGLGAHRHTRTKKFRSEKFDLTFRGWRQGRRCRAAPARRGWRAGGGASSRPSSASKKEADAGGWMDFFLFHGGSMGAQSKRDGAEGSRWHVSQRFLTVVCCWHGARSAFLFEVDLVHILSTTDSYVEPYERYRGIGETILIPATFFD